MICITISTPSVDYFWGKGKAGGQEVVSFFFLSNSVLTGDKQRVSCTDDSFNTQMYTDQRKPA